MLKDEILPYIHKMPQEAHNQAQIKLFIRHFRAGTLLLNLEIFFNVLHKIVTPLKKSGAVLKLEYASSTTCTVYKKKGKRP